MIPTIDTTKLIIAAASLAIAASAGGIAGWAINGWRKDATIAGRDAEIARMAGEIEAQNSAVSAMERESSLAAARARAATIESEYQRKRANGKAATIMTITASDCGNAAKQVWGMVQ